MKCFFFSFLKVPIIVCSIRAVINISSAYTPLKPTTRCKYIKEIILRTSIYLPTCYSRKQRNQHMQVVSLFKKKTLAYVSLILIFTYLLTPWCRVLLEKLTGLQLVKKLPAFHGTRRFITALTSVRHLSLSWASPIQSIYTHPTYTRHMPSPSHSSRFYHPHNIG